MRFRAIAKNARKRAGRKPVKSGKVLPLDRKALQAMAKKAGIKANQKSAVLVKLLNLR